MSEGKEDTGDFITYRYFQQSAGGQSVSWHESVIESAANGQGYGSDRAVLFTDLGSKKVQLEDTYEYGDHDSKARKNYRKLILERK